MSLSHLNPRHLWLVSLYAFRHALRGGTGLVFLFLALSCGLMTAHLLVSPVELLKLEAAKSGAEASSVEIVDFMEEQARGPVKWVLGKSSVDLSEEAAAKVDAEAEAWTDYLLEERPSLLSAVLLILLFSLPFLIVFGAFNQVSGDVQSRSIRYQLVHTERTNIFLGRFLGTYLFTVLTLAILVAVIALYFGFKLNIYEAGDLFLWSGLGMFALSVLSLPWVALCSWLSSAIDSPFGSLTVSSLIIGVVPIFAAIGKATWEPMKHVVWVLPWGIQNRLLHFDVGQVALAALACLGYTLLFLALGMRKFTRRDL